tara:strand:- start:2971 stop:3165 length:195 start_codon:yes stop_codon:yes gene_type:complete
MLDMTKKAARKALKTEGLTSKQKSQLSAHAEHHSEKHLDAMIKLMRKGESFKSAHEKALSQVGK